MFDAMSRSRMARRRPFQILHPAGTCFTPQGPGQNYEVEAYIEGKRDPVTGMIMDVAQLDQLIEAALSSVVNESWPESVNLPATTAALTKQVYENLKVNLNDQPVDLIKVRVYQDKDLWVDQWG